MDFCRFFCFVGAATFSLSTFPASATNQVTNGGFEQPALWDAQTQTYYSNTEALPGWRVDGVGQLLHQSQVPAFSGSQSLNLNDFNQASSISQSIRTSPGTNYDLVFWAAAPPVQADPMPYMQKSIKVFWRNIEVDTIELPLARSTQPAWERHTYRLSATSTLTDLGFSSRGANSGSLIDAISVVPAGEPTPTDEGPNPIISTPTEPPSDETDDSGGTTPNDPTPSDGVESSENNGHGDTEDNTGGSTDTNTIFGTIDSSMSTPQLAAPWLVGTSVSIYWGFAGRPDGYRLYYAPAPFQGMETIESAAVGRPGCTIVEQNGSDTCHKTFRLWDGASYFVAVQAYTNQGASSPPSNIQQFDLHAFGHAAHCSFLSQIVLHQDSPGNDVPDEAILYPRCMDHPREECLVGPPSAPTITHCYFDFETKPDTTSCTPRFEYFTWEEVPYTATLEYSDGQTLTCSDIWNEGASGQPEVVDYDGSCMIHAHPDGLLTSCFVNQDAEDCARYPYSAYTPGLCPEANVYCTGNTHYPNAMVYLYDTDPSPDDRVHTTENCLKITGAVPGYAPYNP